MNNILTVIVKCYCLFIQVIHGFNIGNFGLGIHPLLPKMLEDLFNSHEKSDHLPYPSTTRNLIARDQVISSEDTYTNTLTPLVLFPGSKYNTTMKRTTKKGMKSFPSGYSLEGLFGGSSAEILRNIFTDETSTGEPKGITIVTGQNSKGSPYNKSKSAKSYAYDSYKQFVTPVPYSVPEPRRPPAIFEIKVTGKPHDSTGPPLNLPDPRPATQFFFGKGLQKESNSKATSRQPVDLPDSRRPLDLPDSRPPLDLPDPPPAVQFFPGKDGPFQGVNSAQSPELGDPFPSLQFIPGKGLDIPHTFGSGLKKEKSHTTTSSESSNSAASLLAKQTPASGYVWNKRKRKRPIIGKNKQNENPFGFKTTISFPVTSLANFNFGKLLEEGTQTDKDETRVTGWTPDPVTPLRKSPVSNFISNEAVETEITNSPVKTRPTNSPRRRNPISSSIRTTSVYLPVETTTRAPFDSIFRGRNYSATNPNGVSEESEPLKLTNNHNSGSFGQPANLSASFPSVYTSPPPISRERSAELRHADAVPLATAPTTWKNVNFNKTYSNQENNNNQKINVANTFRPFVSLPALPMAKKYNSVGWGQGQAQNGIPTFEQTTRAPQQNIWNTPPSVIDSIRYTNYNSKTLTQPPWVPWMNPAFASTTLPSTSIPSNSYPSYNPQPAPQISRSNPIGSVRRSPNLSPGYANKPVGIVQTFGQGIVLSPHTVDPELYTGNSVNRVYGQQPGIPRQPAITPQNQWGKNPQPGYPKQSGTQHGNPQSAIAPQNQWGQNQRTGYQQVSQPVQPGFPQQAVAPQSQWAQNQQQGSQSVQTMFQQPANPPQGQWVKNQQNGYQQGPESLNPGGFQSSPSPQSGSYPVPHLPQPLNPLLGINNNNYNNTQASSAGGALNNLPIGQSSHPIRPPNYGGSYPTMSFQKPGSLFPMANRQEVIPSAGQYGTNNSFATTQGPAIPNNGVTNPGYGAGQGFPTFGNQGSGYVGRPGSDWQSVPQNGRPSMAFPLPGVVPSNGGYKGPGQPPNHTWANQATTPAPWNNLTPAVGSNLNPYGNVNNQMLPESNKNTFDQWNQNKVNKGTNGEVKNSYGTHGAGMTKNNSNANQHPYGNINDVNNVNNNGAINNNQNPYQRINAINNVNQSNAQNTFGNTNRINQGNYNNINNGQNNNNNNNNYNNINNNNQQLYGGNNSTNINRNDFGNNNNNNRNPYGGINTKGFNNNNININTRNNVTSGQVSYGGNNNNNQNGNQFFNNGRINNSSNSFGQKPYGTINNNFNGISANNQNSNIPYGATNNKGNHSNNYKNTENNQNPYSVPKNNNYNNNNNSKNQTLIVDPRKCFQLQPNCILVNVAPLERRTPLSEDQCLRLCLDTVMQIGISCKAVVYVPSYHSCDIFSTNHTTPPSQLITLYGYNFYTPNSRCITEKPTKSPVDASSQVTEVPPSSPATSPTEAVTTTRGELSDGCPSGQKAVFQRADGYELVGSDGYVQAGLAETECVTSCKFDTAPDGSPYPCVSIDYNIRSQTCVLTSEAASPQRSGVLVENLDSVYLEKTCLPEDLADRCEGRTLDRQPQKVLIGFGETVESVDSINDCITLCFNAQQLFGFSCLSFLYFYEENDLNCLLNTDSRETQPDFFNTEDENRVEYVGIDNCLNLRAIENRILSRISDSAPSGRQSQSTSYTPPLDDEIELDPRQGVPSLSIQALPNIKKKLNELGVKSALGKRRPEKIKPNKEISRIKIVPPAVVPPVTFSTFSLGKMSSNIPKKSKAPLPNIEDLSEFGLASFDPAHLPLPPQFPHRGGDTLIPRLSNSVTQIPLPSTDFKVGGEEDNRLILVNPQSQQTLILGEWERWTDCDRKSSGRRIRRRECGLDITLCPFESQWCNTETHRGRGTNIGLVFPQSKRKFSPKNFLKKVEKAAQFRKLQALRYTTTRRSRDLIRHTGTPQNLKSLSRNATGYLSKCMPWKTHCRIGIRFRENGRKTLCIRPPDSSSCG